MSAALLALALAAAAPAPACLATLPVVIGSGSIRRAAPAGARFDEAGLEKLSAEGGATVKAAAAAACRARALPPARLKRFTGIVLHQASGCADPCVREDRESFGGSALVVDDICAEQVLHPRSREAVEAALRCRVDPTCTGKLG